jgi:Fe-S cluster assembly protein SufD
MLLGEGSRISYVCIQQHSSTIPITSCKRAALGKNSSLIWMECVAGGADVHSRHRADLEGEGAAVQMAHLVIGTGAQTKDVRQEIAHHAPGTASNVQSHGVAADSSRVALCSSIHIAKAAKKSSGFENMALLIIDEKSQGRALPILAIDNGDVSAGHAARVGHIPPDQMYYLMSRGIPEGEAKKMIIMGFFAPIAERIEDPLLQQKIIDGITARL